MQLVVHSVSDRISVSRYEFLVAKSTLELLLSIALEVDEEHRETTQRNYHATYREYRRWRANYIFGFQPIIYFTKYSNTKF